MTSFRDIAEFQSEAFAPFLPEDAQVNPGVYGAELAFWLARELAKHGVATSYPECEDWGWFIEFIPESGSEFAVLCANVDGARDRWRLVLKRHGRKLFGRDKPSFDEAESLVAAVRRSLEAALAPDAVSWKWNAGTV
jgi:hypothetical protein